MPVCREPLDGCAHGRIRCVQSSNCWQTCPLEANYPNLPCSILLAPWARLTPRPFETSSFTVHFIASVGWPATCR
jgi:hypothetical protein